MNNKVGNYKTKLGRTTSSEKFLMFLQRRPMARKLLKNGFLAIL